MDISPIDLYVILGNTLDNALEACREVLQEAGLPEVNGLLLLDRLTVAYEAKDFAVLMEIYGQQVAAVADARLRLNLDALLEVFAKEAPEDVQREALEYVKEALGTAQPGAIAKYSDLVTVLTKYVEEK